MAKIAIDITPTKNENQYRGVGIYTKKLVESLKKYDKANEYIFSTRGQKLPKVDLVHYPYFDLVFLTLPFIKPSKTIVTIHDVIPLIFPRYFPKGTRGWLKFQIQRFSLSNVDAVITDSEESKKDIKKLLGVPGEKIFVVYLASSELFRPLPDSVVAKIRSKYSLPEKFILYVGDVNYNKNLSRLLEATAKINCNLVLVGNAFMNKNLFETSELLSKIRELGLKENVQFLGLVPNRDLSAIYNAAALYVQPSLYEGFGLPVLEAMGCGTPVACSDINVHREIANDAPAYFNPKIIDEIAQVLIKSVSLSDSDRRAKRKKGFEQTKKFSWGKTAKKTVEVYNKILSS